MVEREGAVAMNVPIAISTMARVAATDQAIQIWTLCSDADSSDPSSILDDDEKERGRRFTRPADRDTYLCTRAALRCVLAAALRTPPHKIKFARNAWGRPTLDVGPDRRDLHFSVSHSNGRAAIVLSRLGEVGIDIEQLRPVPDRHRIIADVLGNTAAADLACLPIPLQDRAFLQLWTAIEAYLKVKGVGFAGMESQIPMRMTSLGVPQLCASGAQGTTHGHSLHPLELQGWVGSVVLTGGYPERGGTIFPVETSLSRLAGSLDC